jgi:hypothetical protein
MPDFPSLTIENVTFSRVICGTNALLGYSHVSPGRDAWIREYFTPLRIAGVFSKCLELGVNAVMGPLHPRLMEALEETEKRTGVRMTWVASTDMTRVPHGREEELQQARAANDRDAAMALYRESTADQAAALKAAGAPICFFHGGWVDSWPIADGVLQGYDVQTRAVRDAGLIPGAACHYSARLAELEAGPHDNALIVTPINKGGWMMHPSQKEDLAVINKLSRPVLAIKTLACGRYDHERAVEEWLQWAVDVPNVQGIVLGLMVEQEAEQSLPFLRERFAAKFG